MLVGSESPDKGLGVSNSALLWRWVLYRETPLGRGFFC